MKLPLFAATALAALALTACGGSDHHPKAATSTTSANAGSPGVALQTAFRRVVKAVSPSVVQVQTSEGLGSGIVFDDRRDIVTNAHVVGNANAFKVTLASGRQVPAALVGRWTPGDLAVVRARSGDLHAATFADSGKLAVGVIVMAVGNPLGLRSSVTQGIVSSLGRTVSEGSNGVTLPSAIQTSAAINPGNSGGALVDLQGRVVGIPTLAALDPELGGSAAPGIGFATTVSALTSVLAGLKPGRQVQVTVHRPDGGERSLSVALGQLGS
jgi:S1-C subfamily serine protease